MDPSVTPQFYFQPKEDQIRVLVSGFSLFQGLRWNISGIVARQLARPSEDPIEGFNRWMNEMSGPPEVGDRVFERQDLDYHLVSVVLETCWQNALQDLVAVAEHYQPHLILMLGRGNDPIKWIFESAAANLRSDSPGFDFFGNQRLSPQTLELDRAPTVRHQWKPSEFLSSQSDFPFEWEAPGSHREENIYICNHLAYGMTDWMDFQNRKARKTNGKSQARLGEVGFLHLPAFEGEKTPLSTGHVQNTQIAICGVGQVLDLWVSQSIKT